MTKLVRYGKPHAARFKNLIEKKLQQYCLEKEVNESDVIQVAVECFLSNDDCKARRNPHGTADCSGERQGTQVV